MLSKLTSVRSLRLGSLFARSSSYNIPKLKYTNNNRNNGNDWHNYQSTFLWGIPLFPYVFPSSNKEDAKPTFPTIDAKLHDESIPDLIINSDFELPISTKSGIIYVYGPKGSGKTHDVLAQLNGQPGFYFDANKIDCNQLCTTIKQKVDLHTTTSDNRLFNIVIDNFNPVASDKNNNLQMSAFFDRINARVYIIGRDRPNYDFGKCFLGGITYIAHPYLDVNKLYLGLNKLTDTKDAEQYINDFGCDLCWFQTYCTDRTNCYVQYGNAIQNEPWFRAIDSHLKIKNRDGLAIKQLLHILRSNSRSTFNSSLGIFENDPLSKFGRARLLYYFSPYVKNIYNTSSWPDYILVNLFPHTRIKTDVLLDRLVVDLEKMDLITVDRENTGTYYVVRFKGPMQRAAVNSSMLG